MKFPEPARFDKTGHVVYRVTASMEPAIRGEKTYPGLCYCERNEAHYAPDDDPGGVVPVP